MIAPFYIDGYVRWGNVGWCSNQYRAFWAFGDHGYYCPIRWEEL